MTALRLRLDQAFSKARGYAIEENNAHSTLRKLVFQPLIFKDSGGRKSRPFGILYGSQCSVVLASVRERIPPKQF